MAAPRHIGCELGFEVLGPSVLALQVAPPVVLTEALVVDGAEVLTAVRGPNGGRTHVLRCEPGTVTIGYRASADPVLVQQRVGTFDEDVLIARRQSRYCPSDEMAGFATREFANDLDADDLSDRIAAWVFDRLTYDGSVSGPSDTAIDTLLVGRGVCRDYAHLTIALCRALAIPARLASVYAPGIAPMDFHAVAEVWRHDRWDVIDATRMAPRSSLVRIATGRDAADTAFAATITGDVQLLRSQVFAVIDGDLPADDHLRPAQLA